MKMDIVSSVTSLTFTAAKDQLHSDTKWLFSPLFLRLSVNLTQRGHFINSHPIEPRALDVSSLFLTCHFVESFTEVGVFQKSLSFQLLD